MNDKQQFLLFDSAVAAVRLITVHLRLFFLIATVAVAYFFIALVGVAASAYFFSITFPVVENASGFFLGLLPKRALWNLYCSGQICTINAISLFFLLSTFFVFFALLLVIELGLIQLFFDLYTKDQSSVKRFLRPQHFVRAFFTSLLWIFISIIGFIPFVVPGIYLMTRLSLASWLSIDKGLGPIAAIRASWRLSARCFWELLFLICIFLGTARSDSALVLLIDWIVIPFTITIIYQKTVATMNQDSSYFYL